MLLFRSDNFDVMKRNSNFPWIFWQVLKSHDLLFKATHIEDSDLISKSKQDTNSENFRILFYTNQIQTPIYIQEILGNSIVWYLIDEERLCLNTEWIHTERKRWYTHNKEMIYSVTYAIMSSAMQSWSYNRFTCYTPSRWTGVPQANLDIELIEMMPWERFCQCVY